MDSTSSPRAELGTSDYQMASAVLRHVLGEACKLLAPFAPFLSDAVYLSISSHHTNTQSVHLEDWPKFNKRLFNRSLISNMDEVRRLASLALAKRAEKGIKVRQPLQKLIVKREKEWFCEEFRQIQGL